MVSKSNPITVDAGYFFRSGNNLVGADVGFSWVKQVYSGLNQVTHGGPVPGYRQRIARGSDATSSLSGTRYALSVAPGHSRHRVSYVSGGKTFETYTERLGTLFPCPFPPVPWGVSVTNAENTALMQFVRKARAAQTQFQGLVFAGELTEVMHMILNPAKALRKGISDYLTTLKKRRRGSKSSKRKALAGTWLEYSFGWVPFINDINAAAELLRTNHSLRERIAHVRAVGFSDNIVWDVINQNMIGSDRHYYRDVYQTTAIVVYRGGVKTFVENPVYMSAKNAGFSLDNFVPSAWELLPYSFLVDYFTNIGDILSAWSFSESNFSWKNRTQIQIAKVTRQSQNVEFSKESAVQKRVYADWSPCSTVSEVRAVNRASHQGPLIPTLEFSRPDWSSLKWLNLAALASQHDRLKPFF